RIELESAQQDFDRRREQLNQAETKLEKAKTDAGGILRAYGTFKAAQEAQDNAHKTAQEAWDKEHNEQVGRLNERVVELTAALQHREKICQEILQFSVQQKSLFQHDKKTRDEVWAKLAEEKQRVDDLVTTAQDEIQIFHDGVNQARERMQKRVNRFNELVPQSIVA
ncbi:MAG: hypothetical protein Q9180_009893, partial [Flavoplaca navasiana]